MSRRDWLRYLTALTFQVLALGIAGSIVVGVWSTYQKNMEGYREYQKRDGEDQKKAANEIAKRCSGLDPTNPILRNCLQEAIVGYQKTQHNDRDLQAQQEMAFWALVAAMVSGGGLLISMVGLGFIWQSLKHTTIAISNDREIGEAQVRAYLSVNPPETHERSGLTEIGPGKTPTLILKISNTGQSPAYDMKYVAALMVEEFPLPSNQGDLLAPDPASIQQGSTIAAQGHIRADAKLDSPLSADQVQSIMNDGKDRLFAVCIVTYFDVFKKIQRKTKFCAYLTKNGQISIAPNGNRIIGYEWALANVHNDAK